MTSTCPACGAVHTGDATCQSLFDSLLVLEFSDPAYGAVHMFTVACFMIQHGRYSDAALTWIAEQLRAVLQDGRTPQQIRQAVNRQVDHSARTWKVNRSPQEPPLPHVAWSMTIADVTRQYTDAASYCRLVTLWAQRTLAEMSPLLPPLKQP